MVSLRFLLVATAAAFATSAVAGKTEQRKPVDFSSIHTTLVKLRSEARAILLSQNDRAYDGYPRVVSALHDFNRAIDNTLHTVNTLPPFTNTKQLANLQPATQHLAMTAHSTFRVLLSAAETDHRLKSPDIVDMLSRTVPKTHSISLALAVRAHSFIFLPQTQPTNFQYIVELMKLELTIVGYLIGVHSSKHAGSDIKGWTGMTLDPMAVNDSHATKDIVLQFGHLNCTDNEDDEYCFVEHAHSIPDQDSVGRSKEE